MMLCCWGTMAQVRAVLIHTNGWCMTLSPMCIAGVTGGATKKYRP
jgi:hypothetical protein